MLLKWIILAFYLLAPVVQHAVGPLGETGSSLSGKSIGFESIFIRDGSNKQSGRIFDDASPSPDVFIPCTLELYAHRLSITNWSPGFALTPHQLIEIFLI